MLLEPLETIGGAHVFVSEDGGATWSNRSAGLPTISLSSVVVDPADSKRVYVGGDNGVYRSTDLGKTWTDFSNGLPNALVGDLGFHAAERRLRAGTRNRGVWEVLV